jgi:hypothetical protein
MTDHLHCFVVSLLKSEVHPGMVVPTIPALGQMTQEDHEFEGLHNETLSPKKKKSYSALWDQGTAKAFCGLEAWLKW